MRRTKVGVLALQGAFSKHAEVLSSLGVSPKFVRRPEELHECEALIIPGGESTTLSRGISFIGLRDALLQFSRQKPIFGTCAGLILMSGKTCDHRVEGLEILDVTIQRNGFGRQIDSFTTPISLKIGIENPTFHAVFIRAPKIQSLGKKVEVLGTFNNEPVLIKQGRHLASTFHPELTNDPTIHKFFLQSL